MRQLLYTFTAISIVVPMLKSRNIVPAIIFLLTLSLTSCQAEQVPPFAKIVPSAVIEYRDQPTAAELERETQVVVLGTGTPIPDVHRAGSSIAVIHKGQAYLFRYADDFVGCFEHAAEAEQFQARLQDRLEGFHLELAQEKTRTLRFGRDARDERARDGRKPDQFDFLGFTFYCGKTRQGAFKVKRRTSRQKTQAALARFTEWIRAHRHRYRTGALLARARSRVRGHLEYYAITDNSERCQMFLNTATRILLKWLNRRSQRRS